MGAISREIDGQIQTAILDYRHEETGSTVSLIPSWYYGLPTYYEEMVREVNGAEVYYEAVTHRKDFSDIDEGVKHAAQRHYDSSLFFERSIARLMRRGLGLVPRSEALREHTSDWKNQGITEVELVQNIGVDTARRDIRRSKREGIMVNALSLVAARTLAIRTLRNNMMKQDHECGTLPDVRSQNFLTAMDQHRNVQPDSNFAFIAGAPVVPSLEAGLKGRDYKLEETRWLIAADIS